MLLSAATICDGLLPFSPRAGLFWCLLLVGASVVVQLLSSSVESSLCYFYLFFFCGVHPFSLIFCLVEICCLVSGFACFLLLGFGAFVHRPSPGVFFLAFLCVEEPCFWWYFCLVWIFRSLRDVASFWDESGFASSSVSLGSQGSLPMVVS